LRTGFNTGRKEEEEEEEEEEWRLVIDTIFIIHGGRRFSSFKFSSLKFDMPCPLVLLVKAG
jgi:hypothetical protein